MKYIVELPTEAVSAIKNMGYDVKSYFDIFFMKPLLNEIKRAKINRIIEKRQVEIDADIQTIKEETSIKKELQITAESNVTKPL